MNPSESYLYPASYYRDMAFFVTKSMSYIFSFPDRAILKSEKPSSLMKSDTPVIETAIDRHFDSDWEAHLYELILQVFQKAMVDESVPVGMVALLELLGDMYRVGTYLDGDDCKLRLAPYPHIDYLGDAMGALMLSYRLVSNDKPVEDGYWEKVMQGIIPPEMVHAVERDFRVFLEENYKRYPPPPILPRDPAYKFDYDAGLPPNPLLHHKPYLRTKWVMYSHIRMAMSQRGEENLRVDPRTKHKHKDLLLQFPPCQHFMMKRVILFQETRIRVPELWEASNKDVNEYLEAEARRNEELRVSIEKFGMIGLGIRITGDRRNLSNSYY